MTERPDGERPELAVHQRVRPDGVHARRQVNRLPAAARSTASLRLGGILAITVLIATCALAARGWFGAGDASEPASPDASAVAIEDSPVPDGGISPEPNASGPAPSEREPTGTAGAASPEATETANEAAPDPTRKADEATRGPTPSDPRGSDGDEEPEWTPRIWSFDPDARFEASVVLVEACLLSEEGWDQPHAQIAFRITWDGQVLLAGIDTLTDDGSELSWSGDFEVSGTTEMGTIATTAEPHVQTTRFYADTQEIGPGQLVLEINTPFEVDPTEPC